MAKKTTKKVAKPAKKLSKEEIAKKLEAGWILTRVVFELVGKPKGHVENILKDYMTHIKTDSRVVCLDEYYAKAEKQPESDFYSTYAEVEMLIKDLEVLTWLCFNFMPASVEVLEPAKLTFEEKDITKWINDLLSKLHEVSILSKKLHNQTAFLSQNMRALIRNLVVLSLEQKQRTIVELSKKVGIDKKQLEPFVNQLIEQNIVAKDKDMYSLK